MLASKEVLTILSSDDDEPDSPIKKQSAAKGKGKEVDKPTKAASPKKKKKIEEITLESSSEEEEEEEGTGGDSSYDDSDAPSDSFLPASRRRGGTSRRRGVVKDSDGDDEMGDLGTASAEEAEEEEDAPAIDYKGEAEVAKKKTLLLAQGGEFRGSTKLKALVDSLKEAKRKDPGLKAVVFSQVRLPFLPSPSSVPRLLTCRTVQFTGFIDLIERKMSSENIKFVSSVLLLFLHFTTDCLSYTATSVSTVPSRKPSARRLSASLPSARVRSFCSRR